MHTNEIISRLGTVLFTHGVECQIGYTAIDTIIPLVDVAAEDNRRIPLPELIQKEEGLFTGECRRELKG